MPESTKTADELAKSRIPLRVVAALFLRLGATSFGGPAAHIALMEDEFVRRRGWLTHAEFLDLVGAANLIPGPNSTEIAIHIGHRVAGWPGLLVAGACFILPASMIVAGLAWVYVTFGQLPPVMGILYGVKPVVIAVVVQAIWRLGRSSLHSPLLVTAVVLAAVLAALGVHELVVLFGVGLVVPLIRGLFHRHNPTASASFALLAVPTLPVAGVAVGATPFGLWPLFLFFVKVGSVLFGSGYVLLAFLRADLVERHGWLSEQQLPSPTSPFLTCYPDDSSSRNCTSASHLPSVCPGTWGNFHARSRAVSAEPSPDRSSFTYYW